MKNKELDVSNNNTLLQLFSELSKEEKQKFLASLSVKVPQVSTFTPETKEEYLAKLRFPKKLICPHCGNTHIVKNGTHKGQQRYLCKGCKKTFCVTTNSLLAYTKQDLSVWHKYINCMMNKIPLRQTARECGISLKTSFDWRHKILDALQQMANSVRLDGIVEADETFFRLSFKGNHKKSSFTMPRKSYKRGVRGNKIKKRGLSKDQVCVPSAVNRDGLSFAKISNLGKPNLMDIRNVLDKRIEENSVLVTDKNYSYKIFSEINSLDLVQIRAKKRTEGIFNIQHINNYHGKLKEFIRSRHGVATKYLNNYIVWNNLVNYSKGSFEEKEVIFRDFVNSVNTYTKCKTLSHRNPIPVLRRS